MKRSVPIILAAILAVFALAGCNGDESESPAPTTSETQPESTSSAGASPTESASSAEPDPTTESAGGIEPYPGKTGAAPTPPTEFGDYTAGTDLSAAGTLYESGDTGPVLTVASVPLFTTEEALEDLPDAQKIGYWHCGITDGSTECYTDAWDGRVELLSQDLDPTELAAAGDQLMEAWN